MAIKSLKDVHDRSDVVNEHFANVIRAESNLKVKIWYLRLWDFVNTVLWERARELNNSRKEGRS